MKVTLYAFRFTIARSLKIAVVTSYNVVTYIVISALYVLIMLILSTGSNVSMCQRPSMVRLWVRAVLTSPLYAQQQEPWWS